MNFRHIGSTPKVSNTRNPRALSALPHYPPVSASCVTYSRPTTPINSGNTCFLPTFSACKQSASDQSRITHAKSVSMITVILSTFQYINNLGQFDGFCRVSNVGNTEGLQGLQCNDGQPESVSSRGGCQVTVSASGPGSVIAVSAASNRQAAALTKQKACFSQPHPDPDMGPQPGGCDKIPAFPVKNFSAKTFPILSAFVKSLRWENIFFSKKSRKGDWEYLGNSAAAWSPGCLSPQHLEGKG